MGRSAPCGSSSTASSPSSATSTAAAWTNSGVATLTIDTGAVVANWRLLRDLAAPAACGAAVKADAYGLGAARVVPALAAAGCRHFFTATPAEAASVRALAPDAETVMLGGLPAGCAEPFAALGIMPALNHLGEVAEWSALARRLGRPLPAAIHLDTGMNRLGLGPDETARLAAEPERLAGIAVRFWMSHLVAAEDREAALGAQQLGRLRRALAALPAAPVSLANSSGIFLGRAFRAALVRPGAALYGVNPTPGRTNPMAAAVRLDAPVLQVRNVDSPMTVGYGATHRVERAGKTATVAVGYADGYARALSGRGAVYVGGAPAPVIGRVSMDLITVDVSGFPDGAVAAGTLVEVIGPHRPVDRVAAEAGTIGYEVLTGLGRRCARVYADSARDTSAGAA